MPDLRRIRRYEAHGERQSRNAASLIEYQPHGGIVCRVLSHERVRPVCIVVGETDLQKLESLMQQRRESVVLGLSDVVLAGISRSSLEELERVHHRAAPTPRLS